ncbi:hypothetical protein [Vibrio europaeus]|uniref:hypothetical protein n=1 Tax=Vibrio europaeus TaxID=300876 RepID=UPI00233F1538|nr:hypothetical protein [Vibrio europaeus]MDC5853479.1 hypothetical protein [Vibrio europaeus]
MVNRKINKQGYYSLFEPMQASVERAKVEYHKIPFSFPMNLDTLLYTLHCQQNKLGMVNTPKADVLAHLKTMYDNPEQPPLGREACNSVVQTFVWDIYKP